MLCRWFSEKRAHVERQLQVNHPPALHVLTKQKLYPTPRVFLVPTYPPPPHNPKKKVALKSVFFFSLITHCTEITFPLSKKKKLPSLSESSATSLFLFVACMTVSWNGFTQTGSKATMISSTFVTTTRKIVSQWLLQVYWLGNLKFYMLQVKIQFRLKFLNLIRGWVLISYVS